MRKLAVFRSVGEVYSGVFRHFIDLIRVAWLPLLVWAVVSIVGGWWFLQHMVENAAFLDDAASQQARMEAFMEVMPTLYGMSFFKYLVLTVVAVGFHRFVLLGERHHGVGGTGFEFGRSEWLYIWSGIKIGLLFLAFGVVMAIVGAPNSGSFDPNSLPSALVGALVLGYFAAVLCVMLVIGRLVLVLLHVAIGHASELRRIWDLSGGNSWRMIGYMLLISLLASPGVLAMLLINWLLGIPMAQTPEALKELLEHPTSYWIASIVDLPIQIAWVMLTITMLSVAYREIIGLAPADVPGQGGEPL
ncbi:MAG: hypothetical protein WA138_13155 [Parvibaculum sp.]